MTFVVDTYSLGLVGRASTGDGCPSCNTATPTKACLARIIEIVHDQKKSSGVVTHGRDESFWYQTSAKRPRSGNLPAIFNCFENVA
jgi:hypothetical protein